MSRREGAGASPAPTYEWERWSLTDRLQKRLELLGPRRVAELAQRLRLDLADPLAGDVERPADLFQGVLGAVADAEPHLQHLLLARRQRLEHPARLVLQVRDEDRVDRGEDLTVLDEIPQMRI